MSDLLATHPDDLTRILGGSGRAQAVWEDLRQLRPPGLGLGGRAQSALKSLRFRPPTVIGHVRADCGTTKLLMTGDDAQPFEAVLIPNPKRTTLCISSQVGCARGCEFCVTATMGLRRNLSAAEIVGQWIAAAPIARRDNMPVVTNVVFMGMGEPLDNLDAVRRAAEVMVHPHGLRLAPRQVTVSTVGTHPAAILEAETLPGALAWSLHAADDATRRRLVPTCKHPITELRDAFAEALKHRGGHLFVEITLMQGLNDSEEQAQAVAELLQPIRNACKINLLPMNQGRSGLAPSTPERTQAFRQVLERLGYVTILRRPRGAQSAAACGQLAAG